MHILNPFALVVVNLNIFVTFVLFNFETLTEPIHQPILSQIIRQ